MTKEDTVLEALYRNARRVLNLDLFFVVMFNKVTLQLDFPLVRRNTGNDSEEILQDPRAYQPDKYLPDRVLSTGEAVCIGAGMSQWLKENGLEHEGEQPPLSCMVVPIKARDQVLGVVVAEHLKYERIYDQRTLNLLSTMAGRVGSTIANARLIDNLSQVIQLGQTMMSGVRRSEKQIVELIFDQIGELLNTDDAYIALYDAGRRFLSFPVMTQDGDAEDVLPRPVDLDAEPPAGLTEVVLKSHEPLRIADVPNWLKARSMKLAVGPPPKSYLGVPMELQETMLGIISVHNDEIPGLYGQDDQQVLQAFAAQAAIALRNVPLYYDTSQRLEALLAVGQAPQRQQDIFELIYAQVKRFIDARGGYIALYDQTSQELSFPLAYEGGVRQEYPSRTVDLADKTSGSLTEIVLRKEEPLRIPDAVPWCKEHHVRIPHGTPPKSWLGVPMVCNNRLVGIISLFNDEYEDAYGPNDEEILQTMAPQAAIAIENVRLYEAARSEVIAAKQLATLGTATAALQHRINNTFNIIAPNVDRLRKRVDPEDETIAEILDIIDRNAQYTSDIIARIQAPLREVELQDVNINSVLAVVAQNVQATDPSRPDSAPVEVVLDLDDSLPLIRAPIGQVSEVFRNLADNACRAMTGCPTCRLTIASYLETNQICVRVQDTGPGISPKVQERLFTLPVPSKEPGGGSGLGLWLSRLILQSIGGNVVVSETSETGTTMFVTIPLQT